MVLLGWATACRLADTPTSRSVVLGLKPTTEGVVFAPSGFGITLGCPPSMTATQLLVVPRSMPMILPMSFLQRSRSDLAHPGSLRIRGQPSLSRISSYFYSYFLQCCNLELDG